jgi:hypothetical protein
VRRSSPRTFLGDDLAQQLCGARVAKTSGEPICLQDRLVALEIAAAAFPSASHWSHAMAINAAPRGGNAQPSPPRGPRAGGASPASTQSRIICGSMNFVCGVRRDSVGNCLAICEAVAHAGCRADVIAQIRGEASGG